MVSLGRPVSQWPASVIWAALRFDAGGAYERDGATCWRGKRPRGVTPWHVHGGGDGQRAQPLHSPLGACPMHMTSKPGVGFRESGTCGAVLPGVCPSAGAPLPPPGPHLRSGEPKKALRASRAEQQKRALVPDFAQNPYFSIDTTK
jgi:hypothetical protein